MYRWQSNNRDKAIQIVTVPYSKLFGLTKTELGTKEVRGLSITGKWTGNKTIIGLVGEIKFSGSCIYSSV